MITVRPAVARDGDALGEVHAAAWEVAYAPMFQPDSAAREVQTRRGRWHQRIAESTSVTLVAEVDGRPLALSYCVPSATRSGLAEIYSFYGHPDGWGSGVAIALMTKTLHNLHDSGYTEVHLWTLRSTAQSRRFYVKCGLPNLVPNGHTTSVTATSSTSWNIGGILDRSISRSQARGLEYPPCCSHEADGTESRRARTYIRYGFPNRSEGSSREDHAR